MRYINEYYVATEQAKKLLIKKLANIKVPSSKCEKCGCECGKAEIPLGKELARALADAWCLDCKNRKKALCRDIPTSSLNDEDAFKQKGFESALQDILGRKRWQFNAKEFYPPSLIFLPKFYTLHDSEGKYIGSSENQYYKKRYASVYLYAEEIELMNRMGLEKFKDYLYKALDEWEVCEIMIFDFGYDNDFVVEIAYQIEHPKHIENIAHEALGKLISETGKGGGDD